jgi:hypothetical protein
MPSLDALVAESYHDAGSILMPRTQIQLTEKQASRLKTLSSRRGVSMAELVRQGVDLVLLQEGEVDPDERRRRALEAAGKLRSGSRDGSTRHDEDLSEGFSQ